MHTCTYTHAFISYSRNHLPQGIVGVLHHMDNFEDHMEVLKKHEQNQVNVLDIERLRIKKGCLSGK